MWKQMQVGRPSMWNNVSCQKLAMLLVILVLLLVITWERVQFVNLQKVAYQNILGEWQTPSADASTDDTSQDNHHQLTSVHLNEKELKRCEWRQRAEILQKFCHKDEKSVGEEAKPAVRLMGTHIRMSPPDFLDDEKNKVLFCIVYKSASSTMKRFFASAKDDFHEERVHDPDYMKSKGFNFFSEYSKEEGQLLLESYTKAIVVRHPFDRLRSCYYNKFMEFRLLGELRYKMALKRTRKDPNDTSSMMHFDEFIRYISLRDVKRNNHWKTYEAMCDPCSIKYDVVMKLETLSDDLNRFCNDVLHVSPEDVYMGAYHVGNYAKKQGESTTIHIPEFSSVSRTGMQKLYDIYGRDMEMFGYDFNHETMMAICGTECC